MAVTSKETKSQRIIKIATRALELMEGRQEEEPYTGVRIPQFASGNKLMTGEEETDLLASWFVTLSWAAQSDGTTITKQAGRRGYYLAVVAPESREPEEVLGEISSVEPSKPPTEVIGPGHQQREDKLYEPLRRWLGGLGYQTWVVANRRLGGNWRNPDIAGIFVTSNIGGGIDVEIATIEAKIAAERIDQRFFEAVAHKRFANRVYFAFAAPADEKIHSEFRAADERFNVGILVVRLPKSDYERLRNGNVADWESPEENVEIYEYWPASFEVIPPSATDRFLRDTLEIDGHRKLYEFGIDPRKQFY